MRLIDANRVLVEAHKELGYYQLKNNMPQANWIVNGIRTVMRIIEKSPTIDPVKRGSWKHVREHAYMGGDEATEWDNFYCSECDAPSSTPYDYCPYCGSKNAERLT